VTALLVAAAGALLPAALSLAPARAADGERIRIYAIAIVLRPDASMHVRETLEYDFAGQQRHGIRRTIPVEFAYDNDRYRVYPLTGAAASSPSGAPPDLTVTDGPSVDLRVGDPNTTVTGVQSYVLDYDVAGVVNAFTDHQELYWNAVGTQWEVPIDKVTVSVEGPAAVQKAICFQGAQGSTDQCGQNVAGTGAATFTASSLPAGQGMTVVASFPARTFGAAAPILRDRWSLARAFSLTPLTGAAGLALFALIGGSAAALVGRRGRDERYLGLIPGLEPGLGETGRTARVPLVRRDPVAVQFTPPKELRPGELGTLIDEQANVVDVTATIVDLAVRGFFTIHEVEEPGRFRGGDWNLVLSPTPPGATAEGLRDYELVLFKALFEGRSEVLLSELKQTFRSDLVKVQGLLYDEVTRSGWFRGNPASVRRRWQIFGFLVLAAGAGLTWLLARFTTFGLVGVAVAWCCWCSPPGCRPGRRRAPPCWPRPGGSGSTSRPPKRDRSGSRRGRTCSAATCPTPSSSGSRSGGPGSSPSSPRAARRW
jgi:Predicted membrane protein (DUF2207)